MANTTSGALEAEMALGVECALPPGFAANLARAPEQRRLRRQALGFAAAALALFALLQFGQAAWIHAKAGLAQVLLGRAWERTLAGESRVKPWPWADTWPVARLIAPAQEAELLVLAGSNGRTIAFGPGHVFGTPAPGHAGNSVIGAHRDTHFRFLQALKAGETLVVERTDGVQVAYRVTRTAVVGKEETRVMASGPGTALTLVTCYPFDAIRAGGPLRYVVTAVASAPPEAKPVGAASAAMSTVAAARTTHRG